MYQFQLLRYCKLIILGTLGLPGHPYQHNSISLQKTLVLIYVQKIYLVSHIFLEILHFEESSNLIGQKHFDNQAFDR